MDISIEDLSVCFSVCYEVNIKKFLCYFLQIAFLRYTPSILIYFVRGAKRLLKLTLTLCLKSDNNITIRSPR